jgi:hypothetical protein
MRRNSPLNLSIKARLGNRRPKRFHSAHSAKTQCHPFGVTVLKRAEPFAHVRFQANALLMMPDRNQRRTVQVSG